MAQDNTPKEAPVAETKATAQKPVATKPAARESNKKKIRIDPMNDAGAIARGMLEDILRAIKSPKANCVAVPGISHFKSFEGTLDDHTFCVKYTVPTKTGARDKLYVSYDRYEFEIQDAYSPEITDFFHSIEQHIKKKFIYDLNSKTYVPRPVDETFFGGLFAGFFGRYK